VTLLQPNSFEADQYRVLGHSLAELRRIHGLKVVAVTSPGAGDGKTTTAVNLAGALAQFPGTRVLLVNADLRRPTLEESLGLRGEGSAETGPGLVGAIEEPGYDLEVVTRRRSAFNLTLLPAGRCPALPCEALQSPRVGELMAQARAAYDHVILDTPPLILVPDARALARWVDGFIVVIGAHRTPSRLVEDALDALTPEKVVGIVYNGDDRPLSGYWKQGHAYRRAPGRPRQPWWSFLRPRTATARVTGLRGLR
jgi:capsular exopolysaccharide synthesis family protein